jgi:hypothetical protein
MEQIATSVSNFFASEDPPADTRLVVVWAVPNSYQQTLGDKAQIIGRVVAGLESVRDTRGGRD